MLLLGPRGPTEDVLQQLQNPDRVVSTLLSWPGSRGVTPLMLACRAGHAACVAILLDNGADPLLLDSITRRCDEVAAAAVDQGRSKSTKGSAAFSAVTGRHGSQKTAPDAGPTDCAVLAG